MAKLNTLTTFANRQYDPIEIPDYCVLELYKDTMADDNYIGYYIVPIGGLTKDEIATKLTTLAGTQDGYTNFILLGNNTYSRKRIAGVFYNDTVPTYIEGKSTVTTQTAASALNVYQEQTVTNNGIEVPCTIIVTVTDTTNPIELYINNNYIAFTATETGDYTIENEVCTFGGKIIDDFGSFDTVTLKHGDNVIKVNATNVSKVQVTYTETY